MATPEGKHLLEESATCAQPIGGAPAISATSPFPGLKEASRAVMGLSCLGLGKLGFGCLGLRVCGILVQ